MIGIHTRKRRDAMSHARNDSHSSSLPPERRAISHAVAACTRNRITSGGALTLSGLGLALALAVADPVSAATFTVSNNNDTGPGSLRRAVKNANTNAGLDDIQFSGVSGTITLNSGRLKITDSVNINGPGAGSLTIDGNNSARMFHVPYGESPDDVALTISDLTLTNSRVFAVDVDFSQWGNNRARLAGNLTIERCVISGHSGIGVRSSNFSYGEDSVVIRDSVISGNSGTAVIVNNGRLTIEDSVISNNATSYVYEGAVVIYGDRYYDDTIVSITGSTISGNHNTGLNSPFYYVSIVSLENSTVSNNAGHGIRNFGELKINNSTVSGNANDGVSGYVQEIRNSTIHGNTGAGIAADLFYTRGIENSIISGSNPDLTGNQFNIDWSLIQDPGAVTIVEDTPGSNLIGQDPLLGVLQDNGGPTETHAPATASPVIDRGDPNFVPPPFSDQRGPGFARVAGGRIDMGAVEVQPGGAGEIGDFVWEDQDGDGIQDAGEPGLAGVTVDLHRCNGAQVATTVTDGDGAYRFTGLAVDSYEVAFTAPAGFVFSPPLQGPKRGKDSNADPATGRSACLTMPQGKVRLGIDAGLIRQATGSGKIGDRVWHDLDADGIQDPGEPGLGGVTVSLQDCGGNTLATGAADNDGAYSFEGLSPGNYKIKFFAPNGFELSPRGQGNKRGLDSDPFPNTGLTKCLSMPAGKVRLGIDAGMKDQ